MISLALFLASTMAILLPILLWPVSWIKDGPTIDTNQLTLWAATDPADDAEVGKINPAQFYNYMLTYSTEFSSISGWSDIAKAIVWLKIHGRKSGTHGVNWTPVFGELSSVNFVGRSVKRMTGIHSLIYWMIRNLGSTSPVNPYSSTRLISYTMQNKDAILRYIKETDERKLIAFMYELSANCNAESVIWANVIPYLIRNRQLFKPTGMTVGRLVKAVRN